MGQLLFKKMFRETIRGGSKRTTIRRWATPRVKPGQRAWTPGVGWLAIESVERLERLHDLTDADARADGFSSASEMRTALKSIYPRAGRGDGRSWFRIAFRHDHLAASVVSSPKPTARPQAPRSKRLRGSQAARSSRAS